MIYQEMNRLAMTVLAALLNTVPVALAIAACAWAYFRYIARVNAATRHAALWGVLGAVLAVPAWHLLPSLEPAVQQAIQPLEPAEQPAAPLAVPVTPPPSVEQSREWRLDPGYAPAVLMLLCAFACALQIGRVCTSYVHLRRLKRSASLAPLPLRIEFDEWALGCRVGRPVKLLISDQIRSPMAIGFHHPAVVLPESMASRLGPEDLQHVLLHELAHIARRDDWTNLAGRLAWAALMLHPIAVWILRRIETEREIACDDWVVSATGSAPAYAATLARVLEMRVAGSTALLATGIGGPRSRFIERIERLLDGRSVFDARTRSARLAPAAAFVLALAAAGASVPHWVAFAQEEPLEPPPSVEQPAPPVAPNPSAPAAPAAPPPVAATPPLPLAPQTALAETPTEPAPHPAAPAPASTAAPPHAPKASFLRELADAGYSGLTVDDVIHLKVQGVTGAYLSEMNRAGWGRLTPQQAIEMKLHGVKPELVREIKALGFTYSIREVIEFQIHGVRPEFLHALKGAGFSNVAAREVVQARLHGLNASDLKQATKYGSNLTLPQIIRLKRAGAL